MCYYYLLERPTWLSCDNNFERLKFLELCESFEFWILDAVRKSTPPPLGFGKRRFWPGIKVDQY
jgi:hypothetical protein